MLSQRKAPWFQWNDWRQPAAGVVLTAFLVLGCGGASEDRVKAPGALIDAQGVALETVGNLPAVVTLTADSDSVRVGAAGVRRVGGSEAVSSRDRFAIGSMTKSMTATLAGLQVQSDRLSWDTRLYDAVPELAGIGLAEYAQVDLRDLLTHHSRLYAMTTLEEFQAIPGLTGTPREQRLQFLRWAVRQPPTVAPGIYQYSNGGYIAAAVMLETLRDSAFEALMQAELFEPLGMEAVFVSPAAALDATQPWPHAYDPVEGRWVAMDPLTPEIAFPAMANPAGGLSLSLGELAKYLQMHLRALRGEAGLLLRPEMAAQLHAEVRDLQSLGWVKTLDLRSRPISFTAGSDEYTFYAMMALSPQRDRAAIVITNGYGPKTEEQLATALTRLLD